jgi:hypothetical protein
LRASSPSRAPPSPLAGTRPRPLGPFPPTRVHPTASRDTETTAPGPLRRCQEEVLGTSSPSRVPYPISPSTHPTTLGPLSPAWACPTAPREAETTTLEALRRPEEAAPAATSPSGRAGPLTLGTRPTPPGPLGQLSTYHRSPGRLGRRPRRARPCPEVRLPPCPLVLWARLGPHLLALCPHPLGPLRRPPGHLWQQRRRSSRSQRPRLRREAT